MTEPPRRLNRAVLGIGLAPGFSDWSHEIATTVMPAFLATMGVAALWVGLIKGVSDGLSSFAKMASGYYLDKLRRRKPVAVVGYLVTAAWPVLSSRACARLGRGVRTPVRKAFLAGAVTKEAYGRAFGFERMTDKELILLSRALRISPLESLPHSPPSHKNIAIENPFTGFWAERGASWAQV